MSDLMLLFWVFSRYNDAVWHRMLVLIQSKQKRTTEYVFIKTT